MTVVLNTTTIDANSKNVQPAFAAHIDAALPEWTDELAAEMAPLYERVKHVVTPMEWPHYAPLIKAINTLKKERNAVILAHNYMTPEIFHCVGDFRGDSLQLAKEAASTKADVIVQAGVHFMAETSKILSPEKTVLIPDLKAGCSLAESITAEDVRKLRETYPGVPIVTYVNTSAAVKAECDITCTSASMPKPDSVSAAGSIFGRSFGEPMMIATLYCPTALVLLVGEPPTLAGVRR